MLPGPTHTLLVRVIWPQGSRAFGEWGWRRIRGHLEKKGTAGSGLLGRTCLGVAGQTYYSGRPKRMRAH